MSVGSDSFLLKKSNDVCALDLSHLQSPIFVSFMIMIMYDDHFVRDVCVLDHDFVLSRHPVHEQITLLGSRDFVCKENRIMITLTGFSGPLATWHVLDRGG